MALVAETFRNIQTQDMMMNYCWTLTQTVLMIYMIFKHKWKMDKPPGIFL